MADSTTKDRILDAAESLFADLGFEATSLRAVTQAAGVNLAAVNYHFQSKEALLLAVIGRHADVINQERMERLQAIQAKPGKPEVLEILDAFFRPVLARGPVVPRLMMRVQYLEPLGTFQKVFLTHMREVARGFLAVLLQALPHLRPEDVMVRMQFIFGGFAQAMTANHVVEVISEGRMRMPEPEETLRQFLLFAAEGLRAPVSIEMEDTNPCG
jgi:AcrR family transcriptional regulator